MVRCPHYVRLLTSLAGQPGLVLYGMTDAVLSDGACGPRSIRVVSAHSWWFSLYNQKGSGIRTGRGGAESGVMGGSRDARSWVERHARLSAATALGQKIGLPGLCLERFDFSRS